MIRIKKEKPKDRLIEIPTSLILTEDTPIRDGFEEEALTRLADSIKRHGVLQPLKVAAISDMHGATVYKLISGRRRLRACKLLCICTVPCIVTDCDEKSALGIALCENLVASVPNMFEQAEAISAFMKESMLSPKQVAEELSVSESYVTRKLKLLCFQKHERQLVLYAGLDETAALGLTKMQGAESRLRVLGAVIEGKHAPVGQSAYINDAPEEKPKEESESKRQVKAVLKDKRIFINTIERAVATLRSGGASVDLEKSENGAGDTVITIRLASY